MEGKPLSLGMSLLSFMTTSILFPFIVGPVNGAGELQAKPIMGEQYGIVLLPGRLISTADSNHLYNGFHLKYCFLTHSIRALTKVPNSNIFLIEGSLGVM